MDHKALVVIDIQNDITKHYKDIIETINAAIERAVSDGMHVDTKKLPEMLTYYESRGCEVKPFAGEAQKKGTSV